MSEDVRSYNQQNGMTVRQKGEGREGDEKGREEEELQGRSSSLFLLKYSQL